ncbi:MAG: hypothetical protein VCD66_19345 [Alphaproteobacteria bacterium]
METLIIASDLEIDYAIYQAKSKSKLNEISNTIISDIKKLIKNGERAIDYIHIEINSNCNRTPLLLPRKNFGLDIISKLFFSVHKHALFAGTFSDFKNNSVAQFEIENRQIKLDGDTRKFYINSKGLVFRGPGRSRHAMATVQREHHDVSCIVQARLRFGAFFDPRFHYDCVPRQGNLAKDWSSCHQQYFSLPKGRRHINIAPNDFTR